VKMTGEESPEMDVCNFDELPHINWCVRHRFLAKREMKLTVARFSIPLLW